MNCVVAPMLTCGRSGEICKAVMTGTIPVTISVVEPALPPNVARMLALPKAMAVAIPGADCPVDCTVATDVSEEVHAAELVTSFVEPSL